MSLYSKRFSGIEIQNDGKTLLLRKKNSSLFAYFDNFNEEFHIKGNITSNSLTISENEGVGNSRIKLKAPTIVNDYTLTLPENVGDDGDFLKTDGGGILSWTNTGGGAVVSGNEGNIQVKSGMNHSGTDQLSFSGPSNTEKILTVSNDGSDEKGNIFITPQINSDYVILAATNDSIHIGREAGLTNAKSSSIGIGFQAGNTEQLVYAVAVGNEAGKTNQICIFDHSKRVQNAFLAWIIFYYYR